MDLLKSLITETISKDEHFDIQDVLSKMKSAEKNEKVSKDAVGFALEEIDEESGESRIVKVYVQKNQADAFEKALSAALDEYEGKKEIAEILFDLREKFGIVNVEWPDIPEDEEVEQTVDAGQGMPPEDMVAADQAIPSENEDGVKSTLKAVIDMMKADAEARQAEAEARKAEAETKTAGLATHAAMSKAKTEEEILDMETYYKEKEEKKKEADKLAKLAKYKHDLAKDSQMNEPSQNDISMAKIDITAPEDEEMNNQVINKDEYLTKKDFLRYIEHLLSRNVSQD